MTIVTESVRRRIVGTLFVGQSVFGAAQIAAFTLMPIIAANLAGSDSAAGVPATALLLGRAFAAYPSGWLMDRAGRRAGLSLGYFLAVLGSIWAVAAITGESFVGFCLAAGLLGVGRGAAEQARFAAADVYPPSRRAWAISIIVLAGTVGAIGGPLLVLPSSQLAEYFGKAAETGPFYLSAALTLLALALTFGLLRPDPITIARAINPEPVEGETSALSRSLRAIFTSRRV